MGGIGCYRHRRRTRSAPRALTLVGALGGLKCWGPLSVAAPGRRRGCATSSCSHQAASRRLAASPAPRTSGPPCRSQTCAFAPPPGATWRDTKMRSFSPGFDGSRGRGTLAHSERKSPGQLPHSTAALAPESPAPFVRRGVPGRCRARTRQTRSAWDSGLRPLLGNGCRFMI
jgi:hypothetical protein